MKALKDIVVALLEDKKGRDIRVIDLKGISPIADYFVIVTGGSSTQIRALVEHVSKELHKVHGVEVKREGKDEGGWILIDAGDVVVHVFSETMREYYGLESVWSDASIEAVG